VSTLAAAAEYAGLDPETPGLAELYDAAVAGVDAYLGANKPKVPIGTYNLAVAKACQEMWHAKQSPGGVASWGPDGQAVRLARDPLAGVYPLIRRYRPLGRPR
jgi:hypothetical protein